MLSLRCCEGFSLVVERGGYSPGEGRGFLTAMASLAVEHGLQDLWAQSFWLPGSAVMVLGLSCSEACGIILDEGCNPCPLHWRADSLPVSHQGSLVLGISDLRLDEEGLRLSQLASL